MLLLGLFAMALAACGGGGDEPASSSGEQGADQAEESRSQPTPSDNPERLKSEAPAVEEGQADVESGIQVDEIRIEPAGLGGKVKVLITNVLQEECTGPVINMDLVDADDGVAGQMGINSSSPLPAGEQKLYEQRYLGKSVSDARITSITCDNSPSRHGAPRSPTKK